MLWWRRVFTLPTITLLVFFVLARPQEFVPMLQRLPFLHLLTALSVLGYIIDIRLRRLQPVATNTLPWVIAFFLWAILCTAMVAGDQLITLILFLIPTLAVYGIVAHGVQRFRAFQIVAGLLALTVVFIAAICAHQGLSPKQCVSGVEQDGAIDGVPDGRECDTNETCRGANAEPGAEYRCEHVGLLGTYSADGRVRYRGQLNDPNEVALVICSGGLAILLALSMRRRGQPLRQFGYWLLITLCVVTIFLTKSRGGLVAMMLVPGVYAIRKWGWAVIFPAVMLAVPVLILGGRNDVNAEASTEQRYEAWATGLDMWHHSPVFGVGARQFSAHHYLTAHNSFVLVLSELGIVGLFLFTAVIYLAIKTLVVGLKAIEHEPGARAAKIWGMALLAAMCGIVFQINTLSFSYHTMLWLFLGLCGAWYSTVRHHKPDLEIKLTYIDIVVIAVAAIAYSTVVLPLFLKAKGEY